MLVYVLAAVFLALDWLVQHASPITWLFPPNGVLLLVRASSFYQRTDEGQDDMVPVCFGPVPFSQTKAIQFLEYWVNSQQVNMPQLL